MRNLIKYMITDPDYSLDQIFEALQKHKPDFVCYRNKKYFDENEILNFVSFAKNLCKVFINYDTLKNNYELLNLFDGVHLPSAKTDKINDFSNKTVIVSTHNITEVKKAQNADYITFSPVFESKNRNGLGIDKLNEICKFHPNVIALGGIISEKEIKKIEKSKAAGFASIRYFFT